MPSYHQLGQVPPKRHAQFRSPDGELYAEEVFGTDGFNGKYSILYHEFLPPHVENMERLGSAVPETWELDVHRNRHLRTAHLNPPTDDVVDSRTPLLVNDDVI